MKTLVLLLFAIISISFIKICVEENLNIKITKVKYNDSNIGRLILKLKNGSSKKIKFLTWSCSNQELFSTNNDTLQIPKSKCDKNISIINILKPFESKTFYLEVQNNGKKPKIKIAFDCTIITENKQTKTFRVWSNEIQY